MRKLEVERLSDEYYEKYSLPILGDDGDTTISTYLVPSMAASILNSKETWGRGYDDVERKVVEGGLPVLWERLDA